MEKIRVLIGGAIFEAEDDLSASEINTVMQYSKGIQISTQSLSASCLNIIGIYNQQISQNHEKTQEYYLLAIKAGSIKAIVNYASYHQTNQNYKIMKKYYLLAIKAGSIRAMHNYAMYHQDVSKNYIKMKKYFFMAIKAGSTLSMHNYAMYHQNISKNHKKMKKYFLMGIKNGSIDCMISYADYHNSSMTGDCDIMEKYYLMAIEKKTDLPIIIGNMSDYYSKNHSLRGLIFLAKHDFTRFNRQLMSMDDLSDECWSFLLSINPDLIENKLLKNMLIRSQP